MSQTVVDEFAQPAWIVSFGPVGSRADGYLVRVEATARALSLLGYRVHILEISRRGSPIGLAPGITVWPAAPKIVPRPRKLGPLDFRAELRTQLAVWTGIVRNWARMRDASVVIVAGGLLGSSLVVRGLRRRLGTPITVFDSISVMSEEHRHGASNSRAKIECTFQCRARRSIWRVIELICSAVADVTIVIGPHDIHAFRGARRVEIVPHGLPTDENVAAFGKEEPGLIGFVGSGRFVTNRNAMDFLARTVLTNPQLRSARCRVIGDASGYESYNERIQFAGYYASIAQALIPVSVTCAPMSDSVGVSTKVLASLLNGKRTVVTPEAARGIVEPPVGLWVVERPQFADAVAEALRVPWTEGQAATMRDSVLRNHGINSLADAWARALGHPGALPK